MLKKIYLLTIGFFLLSCHDDAINLKKEDNNSQAQSMFYKIYNSEAKNHLLIENLNGIYDKNNISNRIGFGDQKVSPRFRRYAYC